MLFVSDVQVWDISLESATPLYRAGGGVTLTVWSPDERNLFAATPTSLFRWDNFHIVKFNYIIYNKEAVHSCTLKPVSKLSRLKGKEWAWERKVLAHRKCTLLTITTCVIVIPTYLSFGMDGVVTPYFHTCKLFIQGSI